MNEAKRRLTRADVAFLASITVQQHKKYHRTLPTFDQVDRIIFNIGESCPDAKTRSYIRRLRCIGIVSSKAHATEVLVREK